MTEQRQQTHQEHPHQHAEHSFRASKDDGYDRRGTGGQPSPNATGTSSRYRSFQKRTCHCIHCTLVNPCSDLESKNKHTLFLCQTNQSRHLSVKSGAITKQQAYHVCSLLEVRLKLALARWGGVMVVVVFEDNLNSVSS